jgi:hypothetical protein
MLTPHLSPPTTKPIANKPKKSASSHPKPLAFVTEQNQAGSEPNFVLAALAADKANVLNWDLTPLDFFGCARQRCEPPPHQRRAPNIRRTGRAAARGPGIHLPHPSFAPKCGAEKRIKQKSCSSTVWRTAPKRASSFLPVFLTLHFGNPQRSVGRTSRVAFSFGYFYFGEAKEKCLGCRAETRLLTGDYKIKITTNLRKHCKRHSRWPSHVVLQVYEGNDLLSPNGGSRGNDLLSPNRWSGGNDLHSPNGWSEGNDLLSPNGRGFAVPP